MIFIIYMMGGQVIFKYLLSDILTIEARWEYSED